ncbi:hypothetical protein LKO27_05875 [Tessaracoccus sp. OS52]|uniref:hypothetical protein n=1 Tax=Tessaracoccus sp. OS52 TaxID=2886691 RepID=UPI001D10C375|nr:hypothetical protein [Tessaracoccus sp. OS52]MCC2592941.1 hypothetical protein [Tessaracoccus sp. OS52]
MEHIARTLAEDLKEAARLSRLAEARKVIVLAALADTYGVGFDDVLPVLAERRLRVGLDGPTVSEFLCLEVAGLLGCTPTAAAGRIADAVNLKHRHPTLFHALTDLQIDADRACRAAAKCSDLPGDVAERVTSEWLRTQHRLSWTAAFNLLARLIIDADPEVAAEKERQSREHLGIHVWGHHNGTMNIKGRLGTLDARYVDAAVTRIAEILREASPDATRDALRARALGILANPAYALALLQGAAQPALPGEAPQAADRRGNPHACLGHLCGRITVPLSKLRPRLGMAVHVNIDALGEAKGSARVEGAGHLAVGSLADMLQGAEVVLQPVIDLNELPAEDSYVPSTRLRMALGLSLPQELFPFSNRSQRGLDVDHTVPYRPGGGGQTRLGNLAPLSRRAHRAKTAGIWKVKQPRAGILEWTSPLGFRYEVSAHHGTRRRD